MNLDILQEFFFWCLVINFSIYTITSIAMLTLRDFFYKIMKVVFPLGDDTISKSFLTYLGNYKLLITVFNFTPWLAIMIINN